MLRTPYHCVIDYYDLLEYIDYTPQTIATFKLKEKPEPNAYGLDLNGLDRSEGNYFTPKIKTVGLFNN